MRNGNFETGRWLYWTMSFIRMRNGNFETVDGILDDEFYKDEKLNFGGGSMAAILEDGFRRMRNGNLAAARWLYLKMGFIRMRN